jgi:hypothetical protein
LATTRHPIIDVPVLLIQGTFPLDVPIIQGRTGRKSNEERLYLPPDIHDNNNTPSQQQHTKTTEGARRQGVTRQGKTRHQRSKQDKYRQEKARPDEERKTRIGKVRQGK